MGNHFTGHIGQTPHSVIMKTSELSVIQAKPMEDSGVQVIDCMRINRGLLTEIIGGSDDLASFHTASSHTEKA